MAQFVTQGRLKLLFSRDGVSSFGFEPKDPFHYYLRRSVQTHFHTLTFLASTTTLFFSTSSYVNKSTTFNSEARLSVSVSDSETVYDDDDDVDHNDDLACFRGLVLDISYRSLFVTHLFTILFFYYYYFLNFLSLTSISFVEFTICIWVVAFCLNLIALGTIQINFY